MKEPTEKQWAIVTGASKGIGEAIAWELSRRGWSVLLVARSEILLHTLCSAIQKSGGIAQNGAKALYLPLDLTHPDSGGELEDYIQENNLAIDILVNNAGFGSVGEFAELPREKELQQIQLNVLALVDLSHRMIPYLRKRSQGYILNIASTAAFQPGPYMATYYATKAFVLHFSEALATEMQSSNVSVTAHCPGATESEFAAVAGNDKTLLFSKYNMIAGRHAVAKHAVDAMFCKKVVSIFGLLNRFSAGLIRFTPRFLVRMLVKQINFPRDYK